MHLLYEAKVTGLVPALVHTHPRGQAKFSEQDDRNEAELARTPEVGGDVISKIVDFFGNLICCSCDEDIDGVESNNGNSLRKLLATMNYEA